LLFFFWVMAGCVAVEPPPFVFSASGSGKPVILLHGLGSSAESWRKVIPTLARRFKVYVLDYYGHGETPAVQPVSLNLIATGLRKFISENGINRPVIIGHSLGGSAAVLFAERYPRIPAAIVVVDGLPFLDVSAKRRKLLLRAFDSDEEGFIRSYWGAMTRRAENVDFIVRTALGTDRRTLRTLFEESLTMDLRPDLKRIEAPLLFISSDGEEFTERFEGVRDFTHIPIEGAGHFIMLDEPEKLSNAIMGWLESR